MRRVWLIPWLVPFFLLVLFWWSPPRGDDAYYHTVSSAEQVREWREGGLTPRYHRAWNGGTGSFAPTVYSPLPTVVQGALGWMLGDSQRAVGLSLVLALTGAAGFLVGTSRKPEMVMIFAAPYLLAVALTRATTTEAWALAGASLVLVLAMPPGAATVVRGLALAAGVTLVAASQLAMLIQLGWLLAAAWLVWFVVAGRGPAAADRWPAVVQTATWAGAGLAVSGWFWAPALIDGQHLALSEAMSGPYSWRQNFLPGGSELELLLTAIAASLALLVVLVALRGRGARRVPLLAATSAALLFTLPISLPLWAVPTMGALQFPWRFLGPATVLAVMMLPSLGGRWRAAGIALLVLPSVLLPLRLDPVDDGVPVDLSPRELAQLAGDRWRLLPVLPAAQGFYAPGFDRVESLRRLSGQPVTVVEKRRTSRGGTWEVTSAAATEVLLPLQWWPEWRLESAGRELAVTDSGGLVAVQCPAGVVTITATLNPSKSRRLGGLVSAVGLLSVATMVAVGRRRPPPPPPAKAST